MSESIKVPKFHNKKRGCLVVLGILEKNQPCMADTLYVGSKTEG